MTIPLWKKIFDAELQNLRSGCYAQNSVFATVDSLARTHQCSNITARRVLSELAKSGVVKNIPRRGSVVNFSTQAAQRVFLLSPQRMDTPAVSLAVMHCMKQLFLAAAAKGIEVTPVHLDYLLNYQDSNPAFVILHYSANVMGVEALLPMLPEKLIPITIGAPGKLARGLAIGCDSGKMTESLFNKLWESGARRIGYCGTTAVPWFLPRFETYSRCLKEKGIPLSSDLLLTNHQLTIDEKLFCKFLTENKIDALLIVNPADVPFCTAAVRNSGIAVQQGAFLYALPEHPGIVSVVPDCEKFGSEAIRQITRLAGASSVIPRFIALSYSLIEQETLSFSEKA